jgi:hypothetical protein
MTMQTCAHVCAIAEKTHGPPPQSIMTLCSKYCVKATHTHMYISAAHTKAERRACGGTHTYHRMQTTAHMAQADPMQLACTTTRSKSVFTSTATMCRHLSQATLCFGLLAELKCNCKCEHVVTAASSVLSASRELEAQVSLHQVIREIAGVTGGARMGVME